jgi:CheY-specific phosphatase CheX
MTDPISRVLYRVTEEVLERLAFIFSFPEEDRPPIDGPDAMEARVAFSGPFSGALHLRIGRDICPELAGNMLGVEPEETTPDQRDDAVRELVNVICGNLLPAIAGKRAVFNVDSPALLSAPAPPARFDAVLAEARLSLEEGDCDLRLLIRGTLPPDAVRPDLDADAEEEPDGW